MDTDQMDTTRTRTRPPEQAGSGHAGPRIPSEPNGHKDASHGLRGTWGLVSTLASETLTLVRQETELVRAEVSEKVDRAQTGLAELATGAFVAYAGLMFLLLAAVLGLDVWIDEPWLSALIVGGVVMITGLMLLGLAKKNLRAKNLAPDRSIRSLRRDQELVSSKTEGTRS